MICEGCDPRCKSCEGAGNYDPVCTECNDEFFLYQGFCFTDCPDGWEVDISTNKTCTKIVYEIPEKKEEEPKVIYTSVNVTESNLCSKKGSDFSTATMYFFPFTILLVAVFLLACISFAVEKKTRLTATLITFLAPVEVLAIIT